MKARPAAGWTALVTGASSGLGRALALELSHQGFGLVLTGRDSVRLSEVEQACRRAGAPWTMVVSADLSGLDGVNTVLGALQSNGVVPDALVNNAGAGRAGRWSEADPQQEQGLRFLLMDAPLCLTRALLPRWRANGRGALMNVASTGAFQPGPQTAVYYAAKAFLMSWSLALAHEERTWLTVTTLCPGALKTGFAAAAGKRDIPDAPGPEATARRAVRGWRRGRGLVIPGLWNKLQVVASRLLPPSLVDRGVEAVQLAVKNP